MDNDGTMMTTPEKPLLDLFTKFEIEAHHHHHEPIFKVEQGIHLKQKIKGAHTKNLFLTDAKKREFYLITMLDEHPLDIKEFANQEYLPRLSFANEELLMQHLNITPGSVTPFSVINDIELKVTFYLDQEMFNHDILNFHPLRNDMTTSIHKDEFLRFLKSINYPYKMTSLPKK